MRRQVMVGQLGVILADRTDHPGRRLRAKRLAQVMQRAAGRDQYQLVEIMPQRMRVDVLRKLGNMPEKVAGNLPAWAGVDRSIRTA